MNGYVLYVRGNGVDEMWSDVIGWECKFGSFVCVTFVAVI